MLYPYLAPIAPVAVAAAPVLPSIKGVTDIGYRPYAGYNPYDVKNRFPDYKTGILRNGEEPPLGYNPYDPHNTMSEATHGTLAPIASLFHRFAPVLNPVTIATSLGSSILAPVTRVTPVTSYFPELTSPAYYGSGPTGNFSDPNKDPLAIPPRDNVDPYNQLPNPITGSLTVPGPPQPGGRNRFDNMSIYPTRPIPTNYGAAYSPMPYVSPFETSRNAQNLRMRGSPSSERPKRRRQVQYDDSEDEDRPVIYQEDNSESESEEEKVVPKKKAKKSTKKGRS